MDNISNDSRSIVLCSDDAISLQHQQLNPRFWLLLLSIFPIVAVTGNVVVCLCIYRDRNLHTVTNCFIASLATADIMVSTIVMPLAIYVEVNNGQWLLGDVLCDAWLACDVLCCTASILNLTIISIDRFIAVSFPIRYAKSSQSRRTISMLVITWLLSIATSSPIIFGANRTRERALTPTLCTFYNSEFLICSSVVSFYLPCIIMIFLYGRIFRSIRQRARLSQRRRQSSQLPAVDRALCTRCRDTDYREEEKDNREPHTLANSNETTSADLVSESYARRSHSQDGAFSADDEILIPELLCVSGHEYPKSNFVDENFPPTERINQLLMDIGSEEQLISSPPGEFFEPNDNILISTEKVVYLPPSESSPNENGGCFTIALKTSPPSEFNANDITFCSMSPPSECVANDASAKVTTRHRPSTVAGRRRESGLSAVERKTTKTLVIVLGVFLVCWLPFFGLTLVNASCLRLVSSVVACPGFEPSLVSIVVWLGYINSCLNPIIYTIFNIDFRRSFTRLFRLRRQIALP